MSTVSPPHPPRTLSAKASPSEKAAIMLPMIMLTTSFILAP